MWRKDLPAKDRLLFLPFAGPETPCKLQHAFLFARDAEARGHQARIAFEGDTPKWLPEICKADHKLHGLVKEESLIAGVCRGCAMVHGVLAVAEEEGLPLLADAYGHVSLALFLADGYEISLL